MGRSGIGPHAAPPAPLVLVGPPVLVESPLLDAVAVDPLDEPPTPVVLVALERVSKLGKQELEAKRVNEKKKKIRMLRREANSKACRPSLGGPRGGRSMKKSIAAHGYRVPLDSSTSPPIRASGSLLHHSATRCIPLKSLALAQSLAPFGALSPGHQVGTQAHMDRRQCAFFGRFDDNSR